MASNDFEFKPKPGRPVVVQKFGGTSAGTGARMQQIVNVVKDALENENVVVVVSAMSSHVKTEGTTSRLLQAANYAVAKDDAYKKVLNTIKASHIVAVHDAMGESPESAALQEELSDEVDRLRTFLDAVMVIGELSPATMDFVIGRGEKLSAMILAAVCRSMGVDAVFVNLENILERGINPKHLYREIRRRMARTVAPIIETSVPIVTGFFGDVPGGMIETVGRGYSDFTAAMIAAEIKASELQLWKEVDGVYSADPRKVKGAKVLDSIAPAEAAELGWFGSEVIHPFTMAHVVEALVPIRIKNSQNPKLPGTVIDPKSNGDDISAENTQGAVAVTIRRGASAINLAPKVKMSAHKFVANVMAIVDKHKLDVLMVSTSTICVSIVVPTSTATQNAVKDLAEIANVSLSDNMSIISLIGKRLNNSVGAASTMFSALARDGVNIEMISQGASEINISVVVTAKDGLKALRAVHEEFIGGGGKKETKTQEIPEQQSNI